MVPAGLRPGDQRAGATGVAAGEGCILAKPDPIVESRLEFWKLFQCW